MACLQSIQSDSEFDLSMRWLCCSAELCISDSDSASVEGDSGIDFEFAAPAPSQWDDALNGLMKAAEDLIQDGKICPLFQSTPKNRAVKNEYEVGNKGFKIAEYLRMNQTVGNEDLNEKLVGPPPKKNKSWKEILGFKKPRFLRSKSASRAEKPASEARDPWLGRAGSDSKITSSGSSKKHDSGAKQAAISILKGGFEGNGTPAKLRNTQYHRQSSVCTTNPAGLEMKKLGRRFGRKERFLEKPNANQLGILFFR